MPRERTKACRHVTLLSGDGGNATNPRDVPTRYNARHVNFCVDPFLNVSMATARRMIGGGDLIPTAS